MKVKLKNKDLVSIADLSKDEILFILKKAKEFKNKKIKETSLKGKSVAMIFEKPSTRTRVSFEVGIYELGGHLIYLSANEIHLSRGETISDTAKVLSRYVNGIILRTYSHNNVVELAKHSDVPVINALSDFEHPCQILADLFTIQEKKGLKNIKITFVGDGDNNVTNSLILGCSILNIELNVSSPVGYEPKGKILKMAKDINKSAKISITNDPKEGVKLADVIYTDVWTSMGMEKEKESRKKVFKDFQINKNLLEWIGKKDYLIMHCLPAHRGEEITDEILDGDNSVAFDQAENRLHAQKAVLSLLM
ncbi:MAG: ornithine carbamoyltransferase [Candidatus Firestonebacteria bacterium]